MGVCCLCVCVFKLILNILNTVILLIGLLIAGLGGALVGLAANGTFALILQGVILQILTTLNIYQTTELGNVGSDYTQLLQPVGITLLVIGGVIGGLALVGYCGTSIMLILKLYMVIMTFLVLGEATLVAVFFSGVFNPYIRQLANYTLTDYYVDINDGSLYSMSWNIVMLQVQCCGLENYNDFSYIKHNPWPHYDEIKIYGHQDNYTLITPVSCCKANGTYPKFTFVNDWCAVYPNDTISNWNLGCWDAVEDKLSPIRTPAIIICSLVVAAQAVIAIMAYIIIRDSSSSSSSSSSKPSGNRV